MENEKIVVQLDKNWRIESDARSWNLVYNKVHGKNPITGMPYKSRDTTYHINLKQALVKYLEVDMAEAKGIPEVIARIEQAERNVERAVDELFRRMKEDM